MPEETKPVEREAFERWVSVKFPDLYPGEKMCAWESWQASADAALERVLEYIPTVTGPTGGWLVSPKTVENVVEALKGSR